MAVDVTSINELLSTIGDSFIAAKDALPADTSSFAPPENGISLLDVKNDLLLSYLQHLTFLILVRLQHASNPSTESVDLGKQTIKKLIELRAYLDRGVRPLEGRLRYQIDKVLRAAEDANRSAARKTQAESITKETKNRKKKTGKSKAYDSDVSATNDSDISVDSDAVSAVQDTDDEDVSTRPNPQAIVAAARARTAGSSSTAPTNGRHTAGRNGIYKPPRITPTVMPGSTRERAADAEEVRHARRRKNALLDEYVNEEHSSAPITQPSIGSNNTILARGRQHTSLGSRDRDRERERTEYEERNFVRLPSLSKVDKKKERARQARESRDTFGGEDWTGLGGLGDRIGRSVTGKGRGESVLERREKRRRDTQDLPRGDGLGMGESFEKRRKIVHGRMNRRGGGRR